jgi:hypothetical protein
VPSSGSTGNASGSGSSVCGSPGKVAMVLVAKRTAHDAARSTAERRSAGRQQGFWPSR